MKYLNSKQKANASIEAFPKAFPIVYITKEVLNKMEIMIDECPTEIGWLMEVSKFEGSKYLIDAIYLPKQDVHGATTEIQPEGLQELGMELLEADDGLERWNRIRGWGHSHVNMAPNPSGQDKQQMDLFIANGCEFFIRIIANKQGVMKLDLFDYTTGLVYNDLSWNVVNYPDTESLYEQIDALEEQIFNIELAYEELFREGIKAQMTEKVKKLVSRATTTSSGVGYLNARTWHKGMGRYAYPAEIKAWEEKQKKNSTNPVSEEVKTRNPKDAEWWPMSFDELNQAYTEDEIIDIALASSDLEQVNIINTVIPDANALLIAQICLLADDYWHDKSDAVVKEAMARDRASL